MKGEAPRAVVQEIMAEFARLTGLFPGGVSPRRYLWTDAFAVCNFLGLYRETGEELFRDEAFRLVEQVHRVLGRHRQDDGRKGWISGLGEQEGALHPACGGLRIGKRLNERGEDDPFDEPLEWDRDGQYYHYLTKWMHALNRVTRVTGSWSYHRWALELAKAAHAAFVYQPAPGGPKRMYWKMSIDLSYPLVPSMGLHDPLDGLITYTQLQATAAEDPEGRAAPLAREIADMAALCEGRSWATDDPLGTGGLLSDAFRVAQLMGRGFFSGHLLSLLVESALPGLESFEKGDSLRLPAGRRLAFRELGLSIGLRAAERLTELVRGQGDVFGTAEGLNRQMAAVRGYGELAGRIERFWLRPEQQAVGTWKDHREINMVMLATSLSPDGYLTLQGLMPAASETDRSRPGG
jgi:hypothetical protein